MAPPVLLIVPGASSLPSFHGKVVDALRAKGIRAEAVSLASVSRADEIKPGALPDMYDDAARVAARIAELADAGDDVVVVTHSYGGTPGTQAVEGLTKKGRAGEGKQGGVVGLAYISSLVPEVGATAGSVLALMPASDRLPAAVSEDGWMYSSDLATAAEMIFPSLPKEEGELLASTLVHQSPAAFMKPLTYGGFKDVPVSYLVCEDDIVIRAGVQRSQISMIEAESGNKVNVTSVRADHGAPLSATELVADWLTGVARGGN